MHVLTVQSIHNIFIGSQSMRSSFLLAASVAALLPFSVAATSNPPKATLGTFGIDTSQMDRSIKPGDDFYRYVNGKWLATTTIPADKSRYGSFDVLRDKSETDLHVLLNELIESPPTDPTLKKVVDLYLSWMDEATIEKRA
jgi:putative endopeptidase